MALSEILLQKYVISILLFLANSWIIAIGVDCRVYVLEFLFY